MRVLYAPKPAASTATRTRMNFLDLKSAFLLPAPFFLPSSSAFAALSSAAAGARPALAPNRLWAAVVVVMIVVLPGRSAGVSSPPLRQRGAGRRRNRAGWSGRRPRRGG